LLIGVTDPMAHGGAEASPIGLSVVLPPSPTDGASGSIIR
jgi:hypothetical protein